MTTDLSPAENLRTTLYDTHVAAGARMVPFGGWDMPVQYQGTIAEVEAVRQAAGIFDVSHMGRLNISGPNAAGLLDILLTGSASDLRVGRARYCFICNERGGVNLRARWYRQAVGGGHRHPYRHTRDGTGDPAVQVRRLLPTRREDPGRRLRGRHRQAVGRGDRGQLRRPRP